MWHPFFHSYKYDTVIKLYQNDSVNIAACVGPLEEPGVLVEPSLEDKKGETLITMVPFVKTLTQRGGVNKKSTLT